MKKINPKEQPGLAALKKEAPGVVKDMGYFKAGGEKLLSKMTYGGGIDMSEKFVQAMRYGAEKYGYGGPTKKMKMGGTSGRNTYSGSKKKKK